MTANVKVYSTTRCWYCKQAQSLLDRRGIPYEAIDVTTDHETRMALVERSGGRRTVPVIFIGDYCVGGHDELVALDKAGQLDAVLAEHGND